MLTSAAPFGVVRCSILRGSEGVAAERGFPSFLPTEVEKIQDQTSRDMAQRIERVPVKTSFSKNSIMSSCVKPLQKTEEKPTVLLHGFDSSCLEWRYTFPLLEGAGLETWALDVLGWGFSDLEQLPPCDVVSKREHLYQFWRSHIKRPMVLVGPSLGAAIAIDLAVSHPEAVSELVLIDASVYAKGTGWLSKLPRFAAYAGGKRVDAQQKPPVILAIPRANSMPRHSDASVRSFAFPILTADGHNASRKVEEESQAAPQVDQEKPGLPPRAWYSCLFCC